MPRVERLPHGVCTMRIQIIPDDMYLFSRVRVRHALHESHQIVLRAPLTAAPQHLSSMNIERGNQRLSAMTDIFKLTTTQPSRPGRASRILALDGLNAGFLVDTQHYRVPGCAAIQFANHIDLLAKGRIRTVQPLLDPVRANIAGLQNTLHMAAADMPDNATLHGAHHNLIERRRDPSLSFLRFTRQRDQLQPRFLRDARRTATALAFPNTLHTLPRNALAPQADRLHGYAQFLRNHRIRVALMSQYRDARPHHISLCGRLAPDQ